MSMVDMTVVRDEATSILREQQHALTSADLPAGVTTAYVDYALMIKNANEAGDGFVSRMAELNAKRDLIPPAGYGRLRSEALQEAKADSDRHYRTAQETLVRLKEELITAATPKLDPTREALARQELATALGAGSGTPMERAMRVAQHGSHECAAALFSDYGRTLLGTIMDGRDLAETMAVARTAAASVAMERGVTPTERAAGAALQHVDGLAAAIGASGTYVNSVLGDA